jgi:hypothetical protein
LVTPIPWLAVMPADVPRIVPAFATVSPLAPVVTAEPVPGPPIVPGLVSMTSSLMNA